MKCRDVGYWHLADNRGTATFCPLSDNSGQTWILAGDGLSANDPYATSNVRSEIAVEAGYSLY
jgi:hypothetical protein